MNDSINRFLDQRRSSRFDTHLNAIATNDWQEQCAGVVTNISREGVRLEGSRELVDKIFPNFNAARPSRHSVQLALALEEGMRLDDSNRIDVVCNSVYVLREKRDWFQIGLCYQQIDAATSDRLEEFILELEQSQLES